MREVISAMKTKIYAATIATVLAMFGSACSSGGGEDDGVVDSVPSSEAAAARSSGSISASGTSAEAIRCLPSSVVLFQY